MLRTRILAAVTAAFLMLGMSVGGAGAALAAPPPGVGGGPADSPCNFEPGFTDDGVNGEKYNIGSDVDVEGTMSFDWGTLTWTEYQLVFTANPGWTVDLCVKGGSQESNSIVLDSGSVTIDRVQSISHFMWANPTFTPPVAAAVVMTNPRNCFVGTSFTIDTGASTNVTWGEPVIDGSTISITATATGGALFAEGLAGVSDDRTQRTFSTTYEEAGGDDCVLPSIDVTAAVTPLNCDLGTGSFTAGLFDPDDPNADKLTWTTTHGSVPSASANSVGGPGTVTVTVRVADAYLGDFALNDTSGLGVLSVVTVGDIETALITWTFTFVEPDDCPLETVVIPTITVDDYCEGSGPNALRVAQFTVTSAEGVTYAYSVNNGPSVAIVFPDGDDTVTIPVNALDEVVVTAAAGDGFALPDDYEPWAHTFIGAAFCLDTFPTTTASAEIVAPDCLGTPGTITLTNGLGVIWTLNGEVVAGNSTHTVPTGTAVELRASLAEPSDEYPGGFGWNDPDQQTEWTAVMEVDPGTGGEECLLDEDELPTLAFTGVNGVTTSLGLLAVLMTLVGMGFVVRRHQRMA